MVQDNLKLQFIGRGSAFNVVEGNTSAFIKYGKTLMLFDCGSSIFERLKTKGILEGIEEIVVVVTHTHTDHVGSLGTLIEYCRFIIHAEISVVHPNPCVISLLEHMLVPADWYDYIPINGTGEELLDLEVDWGTITLQAVKTKHIDKVDTFGYIVDTDAESFYYSGDAYEVPCEVLNYFFTEEIDYIYHDTCIADYDGNVHTSLRKMCETFNPAHRRYVTLMHLDEHFDIIEAKKLGFNVAEVYNN